MFSIKEDGQFPLSFVIKHVEVNEKVVFQKKKKLHGWKTLLKPTLTEAEAVAC